MEPKISVKTILLFTALFILGTMILGFYSCSGNTTPVSPQLTEEFTEEILNPADGVTTIVNDDGTITIIDSDGDTTTTTPGTTITMDDGTTITTYIVTIDAEGNLIIIDAREGAAEPGDSEVVSPFLEFSTFVQDGELWTGNAIITNNSSDLALHFPRIAFVVYGESIVSGGVEWSRFNTVNFLDALVNPDIYFGLYRDREIPAVAYPTIFIADEDESYTIDPGEVAEHEITVRFDPDAPQFFEVNLFYQAVTVSSPSDALIGEIWDDVPLGIDIEFVEYIDEVSRIAITLDANLYGGLDILPVIVEESLYGEVATFVFYEYNEFDQPVYTGEIRWNPAEDGPINVMAYFRLSPEFGISADSFMDFTTLTP